MKLCSGLYGSIRAWWTAKAVVTVDLPLWREQLSKSRGAVERKTAACHGSGVIPACSAKRAGARARARSVASMLSIRPPLPLPDHFPPHPVRDTVRALNITMVGGT
jgi:hypothetical protein